MGRVLKHISAEEVRTWHFDEEPEPAPEGQPSTPVADVPVPPRVPPEMVADARRAAAEEGRREGHAAGLEQARAEAAERHARVDAVLTRFAAPLADLDSEVALELARMAAAFGARLAGRVLTEQPEAMAELIRRAVAVLPADRRAVTLHLNAQDASALRALSASVDSDDPDGGHDWTVVEDDSLERGDCRVTTDGTKVDARLAVRTARLLDAVLLELGLDTTGNAGRRHTNDEDMSP